MYIVDVDACLQFVGLFSGVNLYELAHLSASPDPHATSLEGKVVNFNFDAVRELVKLADQSGDMLQRNDNKRFAQESTAGSHTVTFQVGAKDYHIKQNSSVGLNLRRPLNLH